MKKSYLMIAAAATLLSACSSNDTFKESGIENVPISFASQHMEKQTKAELTTDWLTTNGSKIGVFGYRYASNDSKTITLFNNEEVTYSSSTTPKWSHSNVRYWDKQAQDQYYFYAYAPFATTASNTVDFDRTTGFTYKLGSQVFADAAAAATIDLCVADDIEQTDYTKVQSTNGLVTFTLRHVLSKLSFKIKKDGFDANHNVRLTSIKLAAPTCTTASWAQTNRNDPAGTVSYTGRTNPTDATTKNITVFEDSGADTDNGSTIVGEEDVNVTTTASSNDAFKSYIVTPNVAPANPNSVSDSEKHHFFLEVKYDITYENGTIDSQTAYGNLKLLFEQNNQYIVTIKILANTIEFDVDQLVGFTDVNVTDDVTVQ